MSSVRFFAAVSVVPISVAFMCFFGGCQVANPFIESPDSTVSVPRDGRFVGDWQTIYADDDGTAIEITALKGDGKLIEGGFLKVGDYWIESWLNTGTWRTSNDSLYYDYADDTVLSFKYVIYGDRVKLDFCDDVLCDSIIAEKVDLAAVRSAMETIYLQDPALYTSPAYPDLMWYLEDDGYELIDFDVMYFYEGERYFDDDWEYWDPDGGYYHGDDYYDPVWYTNGSGLFLVLISGTEAEKTVELKYDVRGNGSAAKLLISPILPGDTLGQEDTWRPAEYCDWYYCNGYYKSKQSKKAAQSRKRSFTMRKGDRREHVWNRSVYRR